MARAALKWGDDALRAILGAIEGAHARYPSDNAGFLDAIIAEIATITGRVYGQSTYDRLIRTALDRDGIKRRPSAPTIQKAIARAQASAAPAAASGTDAARSSSIMGDSGSEAQALRRAVEPVVREALSPLQLAVETLKEAIRLKTLLPASGPGLEMSLQLTQTMLQEAHGRMRRLDEEVAQLRRALGAAEARATIAETRVADMLANVLGALGASASGAEALAGIAHRLEGTERFLKQQNDAVRQHVSAEVDGLRRQNQQLRDQVSHLQLENDQYRRALTTRRGSTPAG